MIPSLEVAFPILERLQDSFDPVSEADVRLLEKRLGIELPRDYIDFLHQYNAPYGRHSIEFPVRNPGPFVNFGILEVDPKNWAP